MAFISEIEAVSVTCFFQRGGVVNEKHGVVDVVFLAEFTEEHLGESVRSRRFKLRMEQFVRIGIDGGVQPVLPVVDPDHGFVDCNVIR